MIAIDMEMPKSCLQCPLENEYNECSVYNDTFTKADPKYCTYEYSDHRPDWCPLKHVEKLMVEHIVQQEDIELFGKGTVKDYLMRGTGTRLGNKIVEEMMCEWDSKPVDKKLYEFADRIRATVCVVRPDIAGGCTIE